LDRLLAIGKKVYRLSVQRHEHGNRRNARSQGLYKPALLDGYVQHHQPASSPTTNFVYLYKQLPITFNIMQFSISNIVAFGMLFAASADALAATRLAPHPAGHTKAKQIKHIAYKCPKNANGRQCADAIKKLRLKEDNGCDVFGKSLYSAPASCSQYLKQLILSSLLGCHSCHSCCLLPCCPGVRLQ
jgi:hypothetical protein